MASTSSPQDELLCLATTQGAAAAHSLCTMLLLGQPSGEDPGDSLGILFRELHHGPRKSRPSVGDAPRLCCTAALWRGGTRNQGCASSALQTAELCSGQEGGYAARNPLGVFLSLTTSPRGYFLLFTHWEVTVWKNHPWEELT